MPRQIGLGGGCVYIRLERVGVTLLVSSTSAPGGNNPSLEGFQWGRVPDSTLLALAAMVPSSVREVPDQVPTSAGIPPIAGNYPRDRRPPRDFRFESSRLEIIERTLTEEGLSPLAINILLSCHRESTIHQYQSTWSKFLEFLDGENINHSRVRLCHVLNFLAYEIEINERAYRTIAAYKCALQLPLLINLDLDINCERTRRFMEGCFSLRPPPRHGFMPTWDLSELLIFLSSNTFEPIETIPFRLLTQKLLALLLIASGRRISEIASLSRESNLVGSRWFLDWLPGFRAKWEFADWRPDSPSILESRSVSRRGLRLCPLKIYRAYLVRRERVTNHLNDGCLWVLNKEGLAQSFRTLVKASRRHWGMNVNIVMFPHQTKKLAISYCYKYFSPSIKKLPKITGNKSLGVVKRSYCRTVPNLRCPVVLPLGTVDPARLG